MIHCKKILSLHNLHGLHGLQSAWSAFNVTDWNSTCITQV